MNYNLAPEHKGSQIDFIRQRLTEVRCRKRNDVNAMCSWAVTLPQYQRAKGVTYREYEALKNTAVKVDDMTVERDQALIRAGAADLRAVQAAERARVADATCKEALHLMEQRKDVVVLNRLQQGYNEIKSRLEIVERAFRYLLEKVKHLGYTYDSLINNVKRETAQHGGGLYTSAIERYKEYEKSMKGKVEERIKEAKSKSAGHER